MEAKPLGTVEFYHPDYSGHEVVSFYKKEGKVYHQVRFHDPSEGTSKLDELRVCKLDREEVDRLLEKGKVKDYRRFYWD